MTTPRRSEFRFSAVEPYLRSALAELETALMRAIPVARSIHEANQLSRDADPWFFSHCVRRVVMEKIKGLDPEIEADESIGQAMSGLIVHVVPRGSRCRYSIRAFKAHEGGPPLMGSAPRRAFCRQLPSSQGQLCIGDDEVVEDTCNLILLWDTDGLELNFLRLIRPYDLDKGDHVREDWNVSVLGISDHLAVAQIAPPEDLPYQADHGDEPEVDERADGTA